MIIAKQSEISKISNFKRTLYEDWKNEDITREEYLEYKQKYENDIERLNQNIERLENEKQKIDCIYVHENGNITIKFKFENEFKRCQEYIENNKIVLLKQVVSL